LQAQLGGFQGQTTPQTSDLATRMRVSRNRWAWLRQVSNQFRHARAVSLLRDGTPMKIIGDVLGHRSASSTSVYLKLATEDLRDVALEIPGLAEEEQS